MWAIAAALNIDPDAVVGKLLRVWAWFDEQTESGNALSVTKHLLDRQVGVIGFCDALQNVGWLDENNEYIFIPNFDRHNSQTAKTRALTAERVAKMRQLKDLETLEKLSSNANSVTKSVTREEKRREDQLTLTTNLSNARFDSGRYKPSEDDMAWADTLELDRDLEMIVGEFYLYHQDLATQANASRWSALFRGWVANNQLPPLRPK